MGERGATIDDERGEPDPDVRAGVPGIPVWWDEDDA